ncbi:MAG: mevalonate kinase [Planctomycetes bacterium]|nr:mevalonate kinase [Planctomycetota bacterium]
MFDRARELLGVLPEQGFDVEIGGTLPVGMGMGSSAALAVSFLRALASLEGRRIETSELARLATEIEKLAHRTPSGIDPAVVASGRPILFRRGDSPVFLDLPEPFPLLAATTGRASNTGEVVASVRALHDSDPVRIGGLFKRIGEISREGVERLVARDLEGIGRLMDENHEILVELTVSAPDVERLVENARASGALGAKVSGAGRGGIVLALCPPGGTAGVERSLRRAGASGVYPLEASS